MSSPRVSVIMPCYQTTEYVAEALDSLRAQTFRDFEAIVINDGCPDTDNLERVLARYQSEIVYIKQENEGAAAARNTAIRAARAPLIALLDSDDAFEPDCLEVQTEIFRAHPDVDVVYPNAMYFGDSACEGRTFMEMFPSGGEVTFCALARRKCSVFGASTVRRDSLIRAGLYDPELRSAMDLDLWLRMARMGSRFLPNPKVLYRYRQRTDSMTGDQAATTSARMRVYQRLLERLDLSDDERQCLRDELRKLSAELDLTVAKRSLYACRHEEALDRFKRANQVMHSRKVRIAIMMLRLCPRLLSAYVHLRYPTQRSYVR